MAAETGVEGLPRMIDEAVTALDTALGRPPFPNPAKEEVLLLARRLEALTKEAKERSRVASLASSEGITTTLPILCAALKDGSESGKPCPQLCEHLLCALTPVCTLSTYPLQHIQKAMDSSLPSNNVALFNFTVASGAMTAERMRCILGIPPPPPVSAPGQGTGGKKKGKGKKTSDGAKGGVASTASDPPQQRQAHSPTQQDGKTALTSSLLEAMLVAPLNDECRKVLASTFDTTAKFLKLVDNDGKKAEMILNVYGHVLLPTLKPASLLPCLDEHLVDNFVDLVQAHEDRMLLLTDRQLLHGDAVTSWTDERLFQLCTTLSDRNVTPSDGFGSLVSAVFLGMVVAKRRASGSDTPNKDKYDAPMTRVCCAAFKAAYAVFVKEVEVLEGLLQWDKQKDASVNPFVSESSIFLANATTLSVYGGEERWLKPLAILEEVSRPTFTDRFITTVVQQVRRTSITANDAATVQPVLALVQGVLLPSLREKTVEARKVPLTATRDPRLPASSAPAAISSKNSAGPKAKDKKKKKNTDSRKPVEKDPAASLLSAPMPYAEYLSMNARVLALCLHLVVGDDTSKDLQPLCPAVTAVGKAYHLAATFPVQQPMTSAMWGAFNDTVTLAGWLIRSQGGDVVHNVQGSLHMPALLSSTQAVGNPLWTSPLLAAIIRAETRGNADRDTNTRSSELLDVLPRTLIDALLATFIVKRSGGTISQDTPSPLYPFPFPVTLGLLMAALPDDYASTAVGGLTRDDAISALLPYLERILDVLLDLASPVEASGGGGTTGVPVIDATPHWDAMLRWALPFAIEGVHRLRDAVRSVYEARQSAAQREREAAMEARKAAALQKLKEDAALTADKERFEADRMTKQAKKDEEREQIRAEYLRRLREKEERQNAERQARQTKRKAALATMREQHVKSQAQRDAERVARVERYQQRMSSLFRVNVFMDHLKILPSRQREIARDLHDVLGLITPDELLEYIVTGNRNVPDDMTQDESIELPEAHTDASGSTEAFLATAPAASPAPVGDFWGDVMKGEEKTESAGDAGVRPPKLNPRLSEREGTRVMEQGVSPPNTSSVSSHSFHYSVAPCLNLFCYAGGNEYGDLPHPLPSVSMATASKAVPINVVADRGFTNLREAFLRLQERGLVVIKDGRARLTVLGFRYHFPYHNEEDMLEVRIHRSRLRVQEAMQRHRSAEHDTSSDINDSGFDEEDEEDEDDEDYDSDQILPEVEFGI